MSHPVWVCGLKLNIEQMEGEAIRSHPVWVCGLKHLICNIQILQLVSHPVWVCGLKRQLHSYCLSPDVVTPCMGVWIETLQLVKTSSGYECHTLYGCVD